LVHLLLTKERLSSKIYLKLLSTKALKKSMVTKCR